MKSLFTSALLTVVAVPFLMAAPHAAKKVQNTAAPAAQKTTVKKAHKKSMKKSQKPATQTAAPATK